MDRICIMVKLLERPRRECSFAQLANRSLLAGPYGRKHDRLSSGVIALWLPSDQCGAIVVQLQNQAGPKLSLWELLRLQWKCAKTSACIRQRAWRPKGNHVYSVILVA